MRQQVALRRAEIRQELAECAATGRDKADVGRSDVFSRLVLANESETEKLPLDDQELVREIILSVLLKKCLKTTYVADRECVRALICRPW